MNEIKPTWRIAQEISRRHTIISLKITLPLMMGIILFSIIILKILGYEHSGIVLRQYYDHHKSYILWVLLFFHLIPVNFYAIMRLFSVDFSTFQLKLGTKDLAGQKKQI